MSIGTAIFVIYLSGSVTFFFVSFLIILANGIIDKNFENVKHDDCQFCNEKVINE